MSPGVRLGEMGGGRGGLRVGRERETVRGLMQQVGRREVDVERWAVRQWYLDVRGGWGGGRLTTLFVAAEAFIEKILRVKYGGVDMCCAI